MCENQVSEVGLSGTESLTVLSEGINPRSFSSDEPTETTETDLSIIEYLKFSETGFSEKTAYHFSSLEESNTERERVTVFSELEPFSSIEEND